MKIESKKEILFAKKFAEKINFDLTIKKHSTQNFKNPLLTSNLKSIYQIYYKKLSKNFNLFFIENNQKWFLGLKPKDNNVRNLYQKTCLTGSVYIQKISFEEKHGDTTELYFFKTNSNPNVLTDEERTYFDF